MKNPSLMLYCLILAALMARPAGAQSPCISCETGPAPQSWFSQKFLEILGQTPVDPAITPETRSLLNDLSDSRRQGILFGHHDSTFYGLEEDGSRWKNDGIVNTDRSDVKTATGSHAGLLGVDIADMMQAVDHPAKKSDEEEIRRNILAASRRGQVVTMSWHAHDPVRPDWNFRDYADRQANPGLWEASASDPAPADAADPRRSRCKAILNESPVQKRFLAGIEKMAGFFHSLRDSNGKPIPILFRPFHEQTGGWFWWGKGHCSPEDFAALWRLTVHALRDTHQVHQLIYVYSPNQTKNTPRDYYQGYPGDEYVDVLALDAYHDLDTEQGAIKTGQELGWMVREARNRGKVAALAETGLESFRYGKWGGGPVGERNPHWFTRNLGRAIESDPDAAALGYLMLWRNASTSHHYFPAAGEKIEIEDFLELKARHGLLLLDEWTSRHGPCLNQKD